MLADNEPMKFYERTISPTLLFRIKDTSKTFTSVFDASLIPKFDTSLIPVYIECTLAIHWFSPIP